MAGQGGAAAGAVRLWGDTAVEHDAMPAGWATLPGALVWGPSSNQDTESQQRASRGDESLVGGRQVPSRRAIMEASRKAGRQAGNLGCLAGVAGVRKVKAGRRHSAMEVQAWPSPLPPV